MKEIDFIAVLTIMAALILTSGCKNEPVIEMMLWKLDSVETIGGVPVEITGNPEVVVMENGGFLRFNGMGDGVVIPVNPVAGMPAFTVEVLFKPDHDGPAEQRFIHFEDENRNRGLIETRVNQDSTWSLDTFLFNIEGSQLTLLDRNIVHPTGKWYWAALSYDGTVMRHYVNGVEELSGEVSFTPMSAGQISIGMRLNRVHWFKGDLAELRFHNNALDITALQSF